MTEKKISQRQLSKKTGISLSTLNGMLAGKASYDVSNLIVLADFFDISLDRLLRDTDGSSSITVEAIPATEVLEGIYRLRIEKLNFSKKR